MFISLLETRKMPRSDKDIKRERYARKTDNTGKVGKENQVIRAFWDKNRVSDIMLLTSKELDKLISAWMDEYEARQREKKPHWWYPTIPGKTLNEVRNTRTDVDKGWHL